LHNNSIICVPGFTNPGHFQEDFTMTHPDAGTLSTTVINAYRLEREFNAPSGERARVKFGTSGHRGALGAGFSALHAQAIAQAVARIHAERGVTGKVLVGGDTRLMSAVTAELCAEVLCANGIHVILAKGPLPTPVFSSEIIAKTASAALIGAASHNPPADMGLKYNPSHGGPADAATTSLIEKYANEYMDAPKGIKKISLRKAASQGLVEKMDLVGPYLQRLAGQVDLAAIKSSGMKIGIHCLGGASVKYYEALKSDFVPNLTLVNKEVDPTFGFIPLDHDGKIRMDPSSRFPMKPLLDVVASGKYEFAGASDPDADRFGVATRKGGLLPPNHALSIALHYLLQNRPQWPSNLAAGRSIGTTHLIDRICAGFGRKTDEVNVGFKYFVDGILNGRYILAGEESAGMSGYRWTTEKDGIMAVMLLAEVMVKSGKDLADVYADVTAKYGTPSYRRVDMPVDENTRSKLKAVKAADLSSLKSLAGEEVTGFRDGDGIKIYMKDSWLLARLSGTEPIAKVYAESFRGEEQLSKVIEEGARALGLSV